MMTYFNAVSVFPGQEVGKMEILFSYHLVSRLSLCLDVGGKGKCTSACPIFYEYPTYQRFRMQGSFFLFFCHPLILIYFILEVRWKGIGAYGIEPCLCA